MSKRGRYAPAMGPGRWPLRQNPFRVLFGRSTTQIEGEAPMTSETRTDARTDQQQQFAADVPAAGGGTIQGHGDDVHAASIGQASIGDIIISGRGAAGLAPLLASEHVRFAEAIAAFLGERALGAPKVAIVPFARAEAGDAPLAMLLILNDDMPFLVDSVMGEIQARGLATHLVLHPILEVRRSGDGRLQGFGGSAKESLIIALMDDFGADGARGLPGGIEAVLADVRAVVGDFPKMLARLDEAIKTFEWDEAGAPHDLVTEAIAFCRWLREGEFTFLGMRTYRLDGDPETGELVGEAGAGLGLLANPAVQVLRRGTELVAMTPEIRRFFFEPDPIIITKASLVTKVHRRAHMDYVGLKMYDAAGKPQGELRIVGLFTSKAYTERPQQIPILRRKAAKVLGALGYAPESFNGKAAQHILEAYPRDELFQIDPELLARFTDAIIDLELRPRTRVLARVDRFDRFVSALVFVPRDRFSTAVREKIGALLSEAYQGRTVAFHPVFSGGPLVRVHFIIGRYEGPTPEVSEEYLEDRIGGIVRTWDDALAEELAAPGKSALIAKYARAFSAGYAEAFPVSRALEDIERIERLGTGGGVAIDFYRDGHAPANQVRAALYRFGQPIPLSERVPVFENLGFRVIDERSYRVHPAMADGAREVCLHDMALEYANGLAPPAGDTHAVLEDCYLAIARGEAENDAFNGLILVAGAEWREAALLRAYAAYLRQTASPFGPRYVAEALLRHGGMTRDLIELFHVRFDPDRVGDRAALLGNVRQRFEGALANVPSLDEDRILRQLLGLVLATLRTNFYQRRDNGAVPTTIAFKLDSGAIEELPQPRPFREIWVSSPRVDGVHLRFAPIARGGLRWSDRPQDFRTEVLGLARAQQVKNTVIVPQGAKGGFFPKRLPRGGSREEVQKEGVASYQAFVSTLLDITDNIADGTIVAPNRVVRHDGDDPYLVVAADKGTATFSDTANALSADHRFWLDDAFASGGSAGYDHKVMGITARGAWECVKRHFREMDRDIQTEPFTVVGVGDMSGDVFGNGMLLSPAIRLLAAFDHRDIFLDPNPDAAASFAERQRLFRMPRSSWADYDPAVISAGGGVFSRGLKSIPLSAGVRAALGTDATALTPFELMRVILKAPADLLWFGGIGTYVRASGETDEQAGDRANDAVRVTAADIRAKVIGEGANLGLTQRGRIEFALAGGRLNTDFIDNSAGVNSSDQEVNIKIALAPVMASGRLDRARRNVLLSSMTEDVAAACLATNYEQSLAISLAERESAANLGAYARLISALVGRGLVERRLEALPLAAELEARRSAGKGLARPEIAVLLSYAKIALSYDLLAGTVLDDAALEPTLIAYFPPAMQARFGDDLRAHKLGREIIATGLTNAMLNRGGPTFALALAADNGCSANEVAQAFVAAEVAFRLDPIWRQIDALDGAVSGANQLDLYGLAQRAYWQRASWFAREGIDGAGLAATAHKHREVAEALRSGAADVLDTTRAARLDLRTAAMQQIGAPPALARALGEAEIFVDAPDIAVVANGSDAVRAAQAYFAVGDAIGLGGLTARAAALATTDPFDRLAINGALGRVASVRRTLAARALAAPDEPRAAAQAIPGAPDVQRRLSQILGEGELSVSRLIVAANEVARLA